MLVENPNEPRKEPLSTEIHTPMEPNSNVRIAANPFKRWFASIVNVVLLYLMVLVFGFVGYFLTGSESGSSSIAIVGGIIFLVIQIKFIQTHHKTIGKYVFKIKAVDYATSANLSLGRYIVRELLDQFFGALSLLILISAIGAWVSTEYRSLTDRIMNTVVINDK